MEYFSELAEKDEIQDIRFTEKNIYLNGTGPANIIDFDEFPEIAMKGIKLNISQNEALSGRLVDRKEISKRSRKNR